MSFGKSIVVLAMSALSTAASAQIYIGGNVGQSFTSFNSSDFSAGVAGVSESKEANKLALKAYVGYKFNDYFALEGGYADLGKPSYKYSTTGGTVSLVREQTAWFLAAKGSLPINAQFGVFGKLGASRNQLKETVSAGNAPGVVIAPFSKDTNAVLLGLGAEYALSKQLATRIEYEHFGQWGDQALTGRTTSSVLSLGVDYKFW